MIGTRGEHLAHLLAWAIQRGETADSLLELPFYHPVVDEIREVVEADGLTRITDLHVWRVGKQVYSCVLTVLTRDAALTPDALRQRLAVHEEIVHATIEIHRR